MDVNELKRTWAIVAATPDETPMFFYSHLFLTHPEVRGMFPVSMAGQRDKLFAALGRIVSNVDKLEEVTGFIQQLGRDHRRFEVVPEHYNAVGASLLYTLQHFLGDEWTEDVAMSWSSAYGLIAQVMIEAAEDAAEDSPSWWDGEVISVDRRSIDVSVIKVKTSPALDYVPGQSVSVELGGMPRTWRYLTPANAPRADGVLEFHVQQVPGGRFSSHAVRKLRAGDTLKLGAPLGEEFILPDGANELLLVSGGTGLAPMKAILQQVSAEWQQNGTGRKATMFHGARHPWNLYDHQFFRDLAAEPWFDYAPVVSDDISFPGLKGLVGDVAAQARDWTGVHAFVCGSSKMIEHTVGKLQASGIAPEAIHFEDFAMDPAAAGHGTQEA